MSRVFLFADEAGCMNFSRGQNISKYFIACSVALPSCDLGTKLIALKRELAWQKAPLRDFFHACEDKQEIRNAVYDLLAKEEFRVDATIFEKSKALPRIRETKELFYKYAWYYHLKHVGPRIAYKHQEMMVTTASVGTKKGQAIFTSAVNDVIQQVIKDKKWATYFCPSMSDPCLQIVDYCTWAIQRKWEREDTRAYDLISDKIGTEFNIFASGDTHHY